MGRRAVIELALASVGGVFCFLGFIGFDAYPLALVAWVPVFFAMRNATPRRAYGLGLVFGTIGSGGGYYWITHLLAEFADLPVPLALLGWFLFALWQGTVFATVAYLVRRAWIDLSIAPMWSCPIVWAALELVYPFQIFPANYGAALYRVSVLTQIVEIVGMPGLTAFLALVNGAVFEIVEARWSRREISRRRIGFAVAMGCAVVLYGVVRIAAVDAQWKAAPTLRVASIQTNLGAKDKHAHRSEFLALHQSMSREALRADPNIDLIVWPESAYNYAIERGTTNLRNEVGRGIDVPVVFGALTYAADAAGRNNIFNTAILTSSTGAVRGMYDKIELLVFGETLPLIDRFPSLKAALRRWFPQSSTFEPGTTFAHLDTGTAKLLPMICYEDIKAEIVRELWTRAGPADALVNVTNDSWYGDSTEPLIHLGLASFRSIQTRRALIRSTNTGISAFVDPVGRIAKRTGQWTRETLVHDVPLVRDGTTTFALWAGEWFAWLSLVLVACGWIASARARRRR